VIVLPGIAEKIMTEPLHAQSNPGHIEYLRQIMPVPCVFNILENGEPMKNYRGRDAEALVFTVPLDIAPSSKLEIKEFFEDTFVPALMHRGKLCLEDEPVWDDKRTYTKLDNWSQVLDPLNLALLMSVEYRKDTQPWNGDFLRADKLNVYSMWNPGEVPISAFQTYNLAAEHLDPLDVARFPVDDAST